MGLRAVIILLQIVLGQVCANSGSGVPCILAVHDDMLMPSETATAANGAGSESLVVLAAPTIALEVIQRLPKQVNKATARSKAKPQLDIASWLNN